MSTALATVTIPNSTLTTVPNVEGLLEAFIADQDVKGSSRELYRRTLKQYFSWVLTTGRSFASITRVDVLQYKEDQITSGLSPLTVGSYITAVRKFYEWTEAHGYYINAAKGIKAPKRKQQFRKEALTITQGKILLEHFSGQAARDYAIVNLMIRTGLRTIEVARANVEDITFKHGKRVLLVHGKGRDSKDEFVVLTDKAYEPIRDYLAGRSKVKAGEPLFMAVSNRSDGRLTTRAISGIAKEGLRAVGIDSRSITAHSLRHTAAVNILRAGGTTEAAQGMLRHASVNTTQIYTATIKEEMRVKNAPEELLDSIF